VKASSTQEVLDKIEVLHKKHLSLRGIIQYVKKEKVRETRLNWGSKTDSFWFDIEYKFRNAVTEEAWMELNDFSEYLNQNFIVGLDSLLEYDGIKEEDTLPHKFPSPKDKVILPFVEGTKEYIKAYLDKKN
jgi:hypothetical protein